jgi:predicted acyl esterase
VATTGVCAALAAVTPSAWAQDEPSPPPTTPPTAAALAAACESPGDFGFRSYDGGDTEVCTARVRSFDGTPLDVDITRDAQPSGAQRSRLIAMLHGFGGDKREYESTTDAADGGEGFHYNSHWFAEHGYYVITYTARGFNTSESPSESHQPPTPPAVVQSDHRDPSTNSKIRLKSREFEIRDTRLLMQLTAGAFPAVDPDETAITGLSYGGGESWVQASRRTIDDFSAPNSPLGLEPLTLQVAAPRYSWTDLAYSLAPNGHANPNGASGPGDGDPIYESSQGKADSDSGEGFPFGVPKSSYIGGFFLSGNERGTFQQAANGPSQATSEEGPIDILAWNAGASAGDPFSPETPVSKQIRRGLTEFRSAYYQDKAWRAQADSGAETAIFAIGGWTDDLFPAVEQFRQYKFLKRLDPLWPVEVHMADVGHPRGQNKPQTWRRLNQAAFGFIESQIPSSHRQITEVTSEPTICSADEPEDNDLAAQRLTALTPEGLSPGRLTVKAPPGVLPPGSGTGDPDGIASDPVIGGVILERAFPGECVTSTHPAWPGRYTALSAPLPRALTYVGLGSVTLPYELTESDGAAAVNARVWDVAPDGTTLLMTRGTYRLDALAADDPDPPAGTLRLPLFGNQWPLEPGHRLRLDLMQVDESAPFVGTFQRSKVPDTVSFGSATLELPLREASDERIGATGGTAPQP